MGTLKGALAKDVSKCVYGNIAWLLVSFNKLNHDFHWLYSLKNIIHGLLTIINMNIFLGDIGHMYICG